MNRSFVIGVAALCALAGCAAAGKAGEESEVPVDGKLDSFARPTDHGGLAFGEPVSATIGRDSRFHTWTFEVSGAAELTLRTSGPVGGDELDTVLYLYRQDDASGRWGRYIARNDDAGDSKFSRLEKSLDAGMYRALVKGYDADATGPFSLTVECSGAGCEAAPVREITCTMTRRATVPQGAGSITATVPYASDSNGDADDGLAAYEANYSFALYVWEGTLDILFFENEHVQDEIGGYGCSADDIATARPGEDFCVNTLEIDANLGTDNDEENEVTAFDIACRFVE